MSDFHVPVLVGEAVRYLVTDPNGIYCDCTVGGGGHARAVLAQLSPRGRLIGLDRDREALAQIDRTAMEMRDRVTLVHCTFARLKDAVNQEGVTGLHGCIFDFGVSLRQLEDERRGFSYLRDGPLDMRMDATQPKTAATVINQYSDKALALLFWHNADLSIARRLARLIVQARNQARITTTGQLCAAVLPVLPIRQRPGYLSRIFQAVRMEVNEEINELQQGLAQALDLLVPGGRLVTIAYHSGEDRQVKHLFQEKARGCICPPRFPRCQCGRKPTLKILTRKAVVPAPEELARNPRARSAKLRAAEKI